MAGNRKQMRPTNNRSSNLPQAPIIGRFSSVTKLAGGEWRVASGRYLGMRCALQVTGASEDVADEFKLRHRRCAPNWHLLLYDARACAVRNRTYQVAISIFPSIITHLLQLVARYPVQTKGDPMHFDAVTVAGVVAELQRTIEGGRVQQVIAPDKHSIGMEIYAQRQRYYLLFSADPQKSRVHLIQEKLRRGVETPSPLLLLLRKYVRGSQVTAIEQPDPTERVLFCHFSHPEHGKTVLVAEVIGQRSNLILLDNEGTILDSLRRVWAGEGVQRPLMPKQPYLPPPPQEKLAPTFNLDGSSNGVSVTQLQLLLQTGGPLWRSLVGNFAGVSPTLAREVAWRATGQIDTPAQEVDAVSVGEAMQTIWSDVATGQWQPGIWEEDGVCAGFAPYKVHGRGPFVATESMSTALETYYSKSRPIAQQVKVDESGATAATEPHHDGYATLRGTVAGLLKQAEQRLERQLAGLAKDEPAPGEAETLRLQAEWLLALSSQIHPDQRTLDVDLGDRTLSIALTADKTPVEQAEQLFSRAAKLERAAQIIPERRAKLEGDLDYLGQLTLDLMQAGDQPEIAAIQRELQGMGLLSARSGKKSSASKKAGGQPKSQPLRYYTPQGFEIVVGRNARQNEQVTFAIAKSEDLWLHARSAPGSHVVIRSGGQEVNEETLQLAAQLAAYHSKLAGERAATVIVTPRRFVSRAPGGRPGQVLVRQEETITVPGTLPVAFAD